MRKTLTVLAVVVVLAIIGGGAVHFLQNRDAADVIADPTPTEQAPGGEAPGGEGNPEPPQDDACPRVEFISAPGTWELSLIHI